MTPSCQLQRTQQTRHLRGSVAAAYPNSAAVEYDEAKVEKLMEVEEFEPLIAVIEAEAMWLIDGRHRLEVMRRRGDTEFLWYVIEAEDSAPYRVLYNGERKPPFRPY